MRILTLSFVFILLSSVVYGQVAEPKGLYGFTFFMSRADVNEKIKSENYTSVDLGKSILLDGRNGKKLDNFHSVVPLKSVNLTFDDSNKLVSITLSFLVSDADISGDSFRQKNKAFEYLKNEIDAVYGRVNLQPRAESLEDSIKEWNISNRVDIRLFWFQDAFSLSYAELDSSASRDAL